MSQKKQGYFFLYAAVSRNDSSENWLKQCKKEQTHYQMVYFLIVKQDDQPGHYLSSSSPQIEWSKHAYKE